MADDQFLSRWSRRKAEARTRPATPPVPEAAPPPPPDAPVEKFAAEPPDEETREQWIEELQKIDIDKLTYADDFKVFMRAWVPAALRRRALRKLWTTDPVLACLDGLNDYEEDFTDAATVVADLKTSWRPGVGFGWVDEDAVAPEEDWAATDEPEESPDSGAKAEQFEAVEAQTPDAGDDAEPLDTAPRETDEKLAARPTREAPPARIKPRRMVWQSADDDDIA